MNREGDASSPDGVLGVKRDDVHRISLDEGRAVVLLRRFRRLCPRIAARRRAESVVSKILVVRRAAAFGTITGVRREAEGAAARRMGLSREVPATRPFYCATSSNKCTTSLSRDQIGCCTLYGSWDWRVQSRSLSLKLPLMMPGCSIRVIVEGRLRCVRFRERRPAALPCW